MRSASATFAIARLILSAFEAADQQHHGQRHLLRICECDHWPIKKHWYPRHEVTDLDAMLWHLEVRYKGMPVLVTNWSAEKTRQKAYERGRGSEWFTIQSR